MAKILYVDMDDVLCDFTKAYQQSLTEFPEIKFPQSRENFFLNLDPLPGAIEAVGDLRSSLEYDVYILTAPSTRNPLSYTEKRLWIENHFDYDFVKKLIISPNKALLKGDFLIDDYDSGKGQDKFQGKLIHFGSSECPDWAAVRHALL